MLWGHVALAAFFANMFSRPWAKDFSNQVYYWDAYKRAIQLAQRKPGKHVNPLVAEWMSGIFVCFIRDCLDVLRSE